MQYVLQSYIFRVAQKNVYTIAATAAKRNTSSKHKHTPANDGGIHSRPRSVPSPKLRVDRNIQILIRILSGRCQDFCSAMFISPYPVTVLLIPYINPYQRL